jgi:hypothetical protein
LKSESHGEFSTGARLVRLVGRRCQSCYVFHRVLDDCGGLSTERRGQLGGALKGYSVPAEHSYVAVIT